MVDRVLELKNVTKSFGAVRALVNVDLTLEAGRVHALVGQNGAGKSTLISIASGVLSADSGTVRVLDQMVEDGSAPDALPRGIAVVYQDQSLVPDLRLAENFRVGAPTSLRPSAKDALSWASRNLTWDSSEPLVDPRVFARNLSPSNRVLVDILKALSSKPRVLILDEPTEKLGGHDREQLFRTVRECADSGMAILYISHRLQEVISISDTITVIRDGRIRATVSAESANEQELVALTVGQEITQEQASSRHSVHLGQALLSCERLSGPGFGNIDFSVRAGEIVGLAGIVGQGQTEFLRGLAGIGTPLGAIVVGGSDVGRITPQRMVSRGVVYLSADRTGEAVFPTLDVSDNLTVGSLASLSRMGFFSAPTIKTLTDSLISQLRIKAASPYSDITELSGGNQQKVVLGRATSMEPIVILADEPTQGLDVATRQDVYTTLRRFASEGSAVVIASSDLRELSEICDRVLVFSRGAVVGEFKDDEISEASLVAGMLMAKPDDEPRRKSDSEGDLRRDATLDSLETRGYQARDGGHKAFDPFPTRLQRFLDGDFAPLIALLPLLIVIAAVVYRTNPSFLSAFSLGNMLSLAAIYAFFGMGQQLVVLSGGFDLSVGALAGFLVVVASFVLPEGVGPASSVGGFALLIIIAGAVGLINWALARYLDLAPLIATLITFIALQGVSLLLRPTPGGRIASWVVSVASLRLGPVPLLAIVAVLVAVLLDVTLRRTLTGLRLRAVGSNVRMAHRLGTPTGLFLGAAYLGSSLMMVLAALSLTYQTSVGDATTGLSYTLPSILVVILGGASIFGGRGSFVNTLIAAMLVQVVFSAGSFMGLGSAVEHYVLGGVTIIAIAVYSRGRRLE